MPLPRCRPGFTDYVFKTVAGVQLPLRVWPPSAATNGRVRPAKAPWLLWIHGGGYTCGKWSAPTSWISRAFADRGYAVVSVGYRLLPQASLLDMVDDCMDAVGWCRAHADEVGLDAARWAVGGASSGATLAGMVALNASPPPKAFVNVYGLLDTEDYLDHDRERALEADDYVVGTEEELAELAADRDPANAATQCPWSSEMPPSVDLQDARDSFGLPDWTPSRAQFLRGDLYAYVAKHRNLMDVIYRRDEYGSDAAFREHVRAHSPYHILQHRESFPPTFCMHGTADKIVRTKQTHQLAKRLRAMRVPVEEVYDDGKGHVYDFSFEQPGDEGWAINVEPCMAFVDKYVKE